ncbi:hypothetical protein PR048_031436 [Dryococelus australis]|uniref:Uncharacterized protein n=1 Tax=Dryococelus australis TaxID=614101 RepID=A0ABQ9G5Z9_9NEOP|nr:hypothetical protein PR048_031436 [Dryococelus australis]
MANAGGKAVLVLHCKYNLGVEGMSLRGPPRWRLNCAERDENTARQFKDPALSGDAALDARGSVALIALSPRATDFGNYSPPTKANRVRFPAGFPPPPDFRTWESCRTTPLAGGFPRGSPVSPRPCIPALIHIRFASPLSALKTSMLRAAEITSLPLLVAPPTWNEERKISCRAEGEKLCVVDRPKGDDAMSPISPSAACRHWGGMKGDEEELCQLS